MRSGEFIKEGADFIGYYKKMNELGVFQME